MPAIFPLIVPKMRSATSDAPIDVQNAEDVGRNMYGARGINPAKKYEKNIIIADLKDFSIGTS